METLTKKIEILEDGKIKATTSKNEVVYLQPMLYVDTLAEIERILLEAAPHKEEEIRIDVTIEEIDGVSFLGTFAQLETAVREAAKKSNNIFLGTGSAGSGISSVDIVSDSVGLSTEATLLETNLKLDQLILNTGGDYKDYSFSNGINEVDLSTAGNERLLLLFRCDPLEVDVLIKNMKVSVSSSTNDDFIAIMSVAKTFDHAFIDGNFVNIDSSSKIQVAVPGLLGVPALVTATGFSIGGRNVFQQFGKSETSISLTNDNPATIPGGVYYALTATGFSAAAKLASAANWAELQ